MNEHQEKTSAEKPEEELFSIAQSVMHELCRASNGKADVKITSVPKDFANCRGLLVNRGYIRRTPPGYAILTQRGIDETVANIKCVANQANAKLTS